MPAHLEFPGASFDVVVAQYVVTAVPDPEGTLDEFARVLKPGGEIMLLSRVGAEAGLRRTLEHWFAPAARKLGWRTEFSWERYAAWAARTPRRRTRRAPRRAAARAFLGDSIPQGGRRANSARKSQQWSPSHSRRHSGAGLQGQRQVHGHSSRSITQGSRKSVMQSFMEALRQQRWDDHRYYHHSRINQTLHLVSAISFLVRLCDRVLGPGGGGADRLAGLDDDPAGRSLLLRAEGLRPRQPGDARIQGRGQGRLQPAAQGRADERSGRCRRSFWWSIRRCSGCSSRTPTSSNSSATPPSSGW